MQGDRRIARLSCAATAGFAFAGALAGCTDKTPAPTQQPRIEVACVEKLRKLFPDLEKREVPIDGVLGRTSELIRWGGFSQTREGRFTFDFTARAGSERREARVRCQGDANASRIDRLELNGAIRRPAPGESWLF